MNIKTRNNTYAQVYNYNQQFPLTKIIYPPIDTKKKQYDSEYQSKYLLGGTEVSGTVWINNSYNLAKEGTGLGWIL